MKRLFCPGENISKGLICIQDKEQAHYIKDVLRARPNEKFVILDGQGSEYTSSLTELSAEQTVFKIISKRRASPVHPVQLAVACAIPKKAKMDEIVDKLVQLGVDRIIPMVTKRVIVRLSRHKEALRLARWNKIAKAALEQCQGSRLAVIEPVKEIREVLSEAQDYDLKLIPTLGLGLKTLKEALEEKEVKKVIVLIGPEGDFTKEEVSLAQKSGFLPVSLGKTTLRVDTAAIAAASFIRLNENR